VQIGRWGAGYGLDGKAEYGLDLGEQKRWLDEGILPSVVQIEKPEKKRTTSKIKIAVRRRGLSVIWKLDVKMVNLFGKSIRLKW